MMYLLYLIIMQIAKTLKREDNLDSWLAANARTCDVYILGDEWEPLQYNESVYEILPFLKYEIQSN